MFFVGILTALVAVSIDVSVEELSKLKYGFLRKLTDMGVEGILMLKRMYIVFQFEYHVKTNFVKKVIFLNNVIVSTSVFPIRIVLSIYLHS